MIDRSLVVSPQQGWRHHLLLWCQKITVRTGVGRLWNATWDRVRALFGRSALFPVVVFLGLTAAVYNSGQLRALAIALVAPLNPDTGIDGGGFQASAFDLLSWLFSCTLLVWSWFLYLAGPGGRADRKAPLAEVALMHWLLPLLVLSPFFIAKVNLWNKYILSFMLLSGPLYIGLCWLGGWRALAGFTLLIATIVCMLYQSMFEVPVFSVVGALFILALAHLFWSKLSKREVICFLGAAFAFLAAAATTVPAVWARGLLPAQADPPADFAARALILAVWWIAPGMMVAMVSRTHSIWQYKRGALAILVPGALFFVWIARNSGSVFGLTTMCLATAMLLAVGSLLRHRAIRTFRTFRIVRHIAAYVALAAFCFAFIGLSPHPIDGKLPTVQRLGAGRHSDFDHFYRRWLTARNETPEQHGPLLLVAVAGGGVRAAAHASLSLAAADDVFNGKFGDRTLAISGVSGGALGAATWLGRRTEHLSASDTAPAPKPGALELSRFYRHDFVSPTLNRLLTHDLLFGMLPVFQVSDRDRVLASTWATSWDELRASSNAVAVSKTIFHRSVASLNSDPRLPLVIFNATAAADGRPAVYSSVAAKFAGAWLLDSSVEVMDAVSDSSRFAVVSPVGHGCARLEAAPPPHSASTPVVCAEGFSPIAIADGGYHDNSGLASLETILDELAKYDASLTNVYVVIIRSNPEIGLRLQEGQRFDRGRTIPELLAPLSVLDTARSARSDLISEQWERRLGADRVMTWDLDFAKFASRTNVVKNGTSQQGFLDRQHEDAEAIRRLQMAPLGWTLDRDSFDILKFQSDNTPYLVSQADCKTRLPQYTILCRILPNANSPPDPEGEQVRLNRH